MIRTVQFRHSKIASVLKSRVNISTLMCVYIYIYDIHKILHIHIYIHIQIACLDMSNFFGSGQTITESLLDSLATFLLVSSWLPGAFVRMDGNLPTSLMLCWSSLATRRNNSS